VLSLAIGALGLPGAFGATATLFADQLQLLAVHAFVGAGAGVGTSAQQAVQAALWQGAGVAFAAQPQVMSTTGLPTFAQAAAPATGPVYAAARRLAALPAAARQAWLATHLAALRSGQLTLAQLP
jgi:hypothetical protein